MFLSLHYYKNISLIHFYLNREYITLPGHFYLLQGTFPDSLHVKMFWVFFFSDHVHHIVSFLQTHGVLGASVQQTARFCGFTAASAEKRADCG